MRLVQPTGEMEAALLDFVEEWRAAGEEIVPFAVQLRGRDYAGWLRDIRAYRREETCPPGFVPGTLLLCCDEDGAVIGAVDIRHRLNDALLRRGGHIGYGVRPAARRRGHATRMLALALPVAASLGIRRALVTCDRENTASARVITRNGGVLENEVTVDGRITQRYWIALEQTREGRNGGL